MASSVVPQGSGVRASRPSHQRGASAVSADAVFAGQSGDVESLFRGLHRVRLVGAPTEVGTTLVELGQAGAIGRVRCALELLDSCAQALCSAERVGLRSYFDAASPLVPRVGLSYTDETAMGHTPWFERDVEGRRVLFLHRLEVWRQANDSWGIWFADDVPVTGQILVRGLRHDTSSEFHIDWNE